MVVKTIEEAFSIGLYGIEARQGLQELERWNRVRTGQDRRKDSRKNKGRRITDKKGVK